jgi:superfamily II DNA or RNA helicase
MPATVPICLKICLRSHPEISKARVYVTVGMMTTGYDCPDLLTLGLFGPISR